jgi:hypothetical protein
VHKKGQENEENVARAQIFGAEKDG